MKVEHETKAVALKHGLTAPSITATGTGQIARDIIQEAKKHAIPMFGNRDLANLLCTLELGEEIPRELYITVAHILAMAFELQGKAPPGWVQGEHGWEKVIAPR